MTPTAPATPLTGTRLTRTLGELTGLRPGQTRHRFAERLGQFIDLGHSIRLAQLQLADQGESRRPATSARDAITADFLRKQVAIVQSVLRNLNETREADTQRVRLPEEATDVWHSSETRFEPYRAFYLTQQRLIAVKARNLHVRVREAVADLAPELEQLAQLDEALGSALADESRRLLGTVPDLLQSRFEQLLSAAPESPDPALAQFKAEVRDLLLAEVDIRLLPTVGLIEAIDDTLEHHE